jgi:hypothetical protein
VAFEKPSRIKISTWQPRKRGGTISRYSKCDLVNDGDIQRLSFKRYSEFDMQSRSVHRTLGTISTGSECRLDEVARQVYGDFRFYWAILMFNRPLGLNPLRFTANQVVAFPYQFYIQNQLMSRGLRDA